MSGGPRPPLDLAVELVTPSGVTTRWDGDSSHAGNVPRGITFTTKRGDGFSDGPSISLARRIDQDYSDINLYDDVRLIGADGSIAYEGYVAADPRTFDAGHTVSIRVAGPMTHAQRRPFSEIYVDRGLAKWAQPSLTRQAAIVAGGGTLDGVPLSMDGTGVRWSPTAGQALANADDTEAWYWAPSGATVSKVMYRGQVVGTWTNFEVPTLVGAAAWVTQESYGLTLDNTIRTQALTTARDQLRLRAFTSAGTTPAAGLLRSFDLLAMYGTSAITTRPVAGDADGVYVSDVIIDICNRFVPKLNPSGVQATAYPVGQLVFEQVQPYDAWTQVNGLHHLELAVWENKILHYGPADLTDYDWEIRLSDDGVTVDVPGDSVEQLANGIVVSYLDVVTGRVEVLNPVTTPTLADPNPLNPATLAGELAWSPLDLSSIPMTAADATQIGIVELVELNQVKAAGTITVEGHIRDRAGHWQQAWKVRAGDTVAITDHPNDRPRLIGETTWDHDSLKLTIAVDSTLLVVDAFIDRLTMGLQAANLI